MTEHLLFAHLLDKKNGEGLLHLVSIVDLEYVLLSSISVTSGGKSKRQSLKDLKGQTLIGSTINA